MITIYVVTYNEEVILPYFIKHYRKNFAECNIVIYDNYSTDNTEQIGLDNNCTIIKYDTDNKLSDLKHVEIKNNAWKNAHTDWVMNLDCDEFLDMNYEQLKHEENLGTNIIKPQAWNMINMKENECNPDEMFHGVRHEYHDKCVIFNKKFIKHINYDAGCHHCHPIGKVQFNTNQYNLLHFHYLSEDYRIKKHRLHCDRLSEHNKTQGWGIHYFQNEENIRNQFISMRKSAIKIRNDI